VTAVNCRRDGSFVDVTVWIVDVTAVNCRVWPFHATVRFNCLSLYWHTGSHSKDHYYKW